MTQAWMNQIFAAGQANAGGVVRRATADVERYIGLEELIAECRVRGFHVIETGDQIVILCHEGELAIHC